MKKIILKQKSREKWFIDGDLNSRYFHNIMKSWKSECNPLCENKWGRVLVVEGVKDEVKGFFKRGSKKSMIVDQF